MLESQNEQTDVLCDDHQIIRIANSLLEIEVKEVSHTPVSYTHLTLPTKA